MSIIGKSIYIDNVISVLASHEYHFTFAMSEQHHTESSTAINVTLPLSAEAKSIISKQRTNPSLTLSIIPQIFPAEYHGLGYITLYNDLLTNKTSNKFTYSGFSYLNSTLTSLSIIEYNESQERICTYANWMISSYYNAQVTPDGDIVIRSTTNVGSWEAGNWDLYIRYTDITNINTFPNSIDMSSADWLTNKRINSSLNIIDQTGMDVTNYMPCTKLNEVHIKNLNIFSPISGQYYGRLVICDSSKNILSVYNPNDGSNIFVSQEGGITLINLWSSDITSTIRDNMAYIRFVCLSNPYNPLVTIV